MELSFYCFLQNYIWDRKAFVLIFFFFWLPLGLFCRIQRTGFLLYFFYHLQWKQINAKLPLMVLIMSGLCAYSFFNFMRCVNFIRKTNLPLCQLPFKHLYIEFGSTLHPKKASMKMSLVRFIMLNSHLFSIFWSVDKAV